MNQVILNSKPYYIYKGVYIDTFKEPHYSFKILINELNRTIRTLEITYPIVLVTLANIYSHVDKDIIYLNLNPAHNALVQNSKCNFHEYEHIKDDPEIGDSLECSWQEVIQRELCHEYAHLYKYSGPITKNYPTDDSYHNDVWQSCYHHLISQLNQPKGNTNHGNR